MPRKEYKYRGKTFIRKEMPSGQCGKCYFDIQNNLSCLEILYGENKSMPSCMGKHVDWIYVEIRKRKK
jgi:hypothetical protein